MLFLVSLSCGFSIVAMDIGRVFEDLIFFIVWGFRVEVGVWGYRF